MRSATESALVDTGLIKVLIVVSIKLLEMLWKMLGADHPMEAHKVDSRAIYELGKGEDTKESKGVKIILKLRKGMNENLYAHIYFVFKPRTIIR